MRGIRPRKLTAKQEAFCVAIAGGASQAEAYKSAYDIQKMQPHTLYKRASEMMSVEEISSRVAELRIPAIKKAQITLEGHLDDLMRLRDMAAQSGQYGSAVTAEIARGKAAGITADMQPKDKSAAEALLEIAKRLPV